MFILILPRTQKFNDAKINNAGTLAVQVRIKKAIANDNPLITKNHNSSKKNDVIIIHSDVKKTNVITSVKTKLKLIDIPKNTKFGNGITIGGFTTVDNKKCFCIIMVFETNPSSIMTELKTLLD